MFPLPYMLHLNLQMVLAYSKKHHWHAPCTLPPNTAIVCAARYIDLKHQHSQWGSCPCPDGPSVSPACEGESAILKVADLLFTIVCQLACLLCYTAALVAYRFSSAPAFPCRGGPAPCSLHCLLVCQARRESYGQLQLAQLNGDKPIQSCPTTAGSCCGPMPDGMSSGPR